MSHLAYFHIIVLKDNKRLYFKTVPSKLQKRLQVLEFDKLHDDDHFSDLMDEHNSSINDELLKISSEFPDYTFMIREFQIEHDDITYDIFRNGKHFGFTMNLPLPNINEVDIE